MVTPNEIAELRNNGVRLPPVDLRRFLYQVRNQNPFESCTGFATATIQEFYLYRRDGKFSKSHISSPSFLWHEYRDTTCNVAGHQNPDQSFRKDRDEGAHYPGYMDKFVRLGCCRESMNEYDYSEETFPGFSMPHDPHMSHFKNRNTLKPSRGAYSEAQNRRLFSGYTDIGNDYNAWLAELYNGNVLFIRIDKYPAEFFHLEGDGFFDHVNVQLGGHAMAIVGYLPDMNGHEVFIVRNSFGAGWKDEGYCYYTFDALHQSLRSPPVKMELNFRPRELPGMPALPIAVPHPEPSPHTPVTGPVHHPPTPTPTTPGTPPATPTPAPTPTPTPTPTPGTPPHIPTPTPTPAHGHGDYIYQWWLFDQEADVNFANAQGLSPHTLKHRHNMGRKLDGPGQPDDDIFGLGANANSPFIDVDAFISDPANRGKWVGLGACRVSEIPIPQRHLATAHDGFWKWTGKKIPGGVVNSELIVKKSIIGKLDSDLTVKFSITFPDGRVHEMPIVVPAGDNPEEHFTLRTVPGKHKIDEHDIPGFDHVTQPHVEVDILPGRRATATFTNKPSGSDIIPKLVVHKKLSSKAESDIAFKFTVTLPDSTTGDLQVLIKAGEDNGQYILETLPGTHKVEEHDTDGYEHSSPKKVDVDVPADGEAKASFTNKKKGSDDDDVVITKAIIIPKKSAKLPHPPNHGARHEPEFKRGQTMSIADKDDGLKSGEAGAGEIDFLLVKERGKVILGWVCYILNDKDEIMNPRDFHLRVLMSKRGKPYEYNGKDEHFGYKYNYFQAGEPASDMGNAKNQITFDPYMDVPENAEPGMYKIVLEIAEWPKGWGIRSLTQPDLGTLKIMDQNYIRFRII